ncbi:MAG TPA: S-layer homology domain-containing protein [Anaerolineales bacterium]|nr:S-layer homology domain-containing protein [Anaerolineales bacterium]
MKYKTSRFVHLFFVLILFFNLAGAPAPEMVQPAVTTSNPILFVTQLPIRQDFTTITAVFGNHKAGMQDVGRGGDLWIRYGDGSLKNLTQAAGYGSTGANGFQDHNAISVRDPYVYWDGTKALFSMVIGAPEQQYTVETYYWQIYEITGLGKNQSPVITKVPNQPEGFNNITPIYGTDDRIIFTSDRPRDGSLHLYPQLDEYEEAPTVSGLWSLDPATGDLFMMNHAPSGDFTPIIDSYGRVIFTQWDHLQRDQQADADKYDGGTYGTFNWSDESAGSTPLNIRTEIFPEPRADEEAAGTNLMQHTFNMFMPWQINEDGTEPETINHIGRHELAHYISNSFTDDPNVVYNTPGPIYNPNKADIFLQIKESPTKPGTYFGATMPEFGTHGSGQIISMTAPPGLDADHISITHITHPDTSSTTATANNSGHYRDPLPLSDGQIIAAHTTQTGGDASSGASIYDFRLKTLAVGGNGYYTASQALTSGISETISYWSPDTKVTFSGVLWELQPVEVRARTRPAKLTATLEATEQAVFSQAGVNVADFQAYMQANNLALIVSHNVTTRDHSDVQQPLNLRVPGGAETIFASGKVYDVQYLQIFQADQLRGIGGTQSPRPGRRVLAQNLHDPAVAFVQPPNPDGPVGSVVLGLDGSMAAFVPARRALTWQLTDPSGVGVVRERVWVTLQPGEIRVCKSCHGVNTADQAGNPPPDNEPQALLNLLEYWKVAANSLFADVPASHWAASFIERLYNAGITGGCGTAPLLYCPEATVTRAQMAIFILRGMHGSAYVPPTATGAVFGDVPAGSFAADWIEQLAAEGVTAGCGNGNYCPDATITRAQMAIFLLRGEHGSAYTPPAGTGAVFGDVPAGSFAVDWIEQLAAEGITSGCGGGNYCPDANVTRAEMAVFLVRAFNLP